jgi:hypothetical protein
VIRFVTGWAWVLHANVLGKYPGSNFIDDVLFTFSHAR